MAQGILAGIRVIELASVLAGPAVGAALAELGAEVIKVENLLGRGDVTRTWKLATEPEGRDISAYFSSVNWGKRSIALNLKDKAGLSVLHELVKKADIVLASYKPGDDEKLGVDFVTLAEINPRLIYGRTTGYGQDDQRAGYDAVIQAESGFMFMNGEAGGRPTKMPVALIDVLAAHQLKEAVLLALYEREKTGRGRFVEVSLLQAGIASLANQAANWLVGGEVPARIGSEHPNIVPYGSVFRGSDGAEIVLAIGSDKQFRELCAILGRSELGRDERFVSNLLRVKNRQHLNVILRELCSRIDSRALLDTCASRGVPAGLVRDMRQVFEQAAAQELLLEAVSGQGQALKGVRQNAFSVGQWRNAELSAPPHYGEHSAAVLKEVLAYSEQRIDELQASGVLYDAGHS